MFNKKTKFILGLVAIVLIIWVAFDGSSKYQNWQKWREIKKQAEEFEIKQKKFETLIKADTYGGATPQETLEMFIKAVEAGDYELASRYFVVEKQGEWRKNLLTASNVDFLTQDLKKINQRLIKEKFSFEQKDNFVIADPIFIRFIKYPTNIWKINEI